MRKHEGSVPTSHWPFQKIRFRFISRSEKSSSGAAQFPHPTRLLKHHVNSPTFTKSRQTQLRALPPARKASSILMLQNRCAMGLIEAPRDLSGPIPAVLWRYERLLACLLVKIVI